MGLLDKLWDDTLAGPRPDSGLSKLRKFNSFSPSSSSSSVPLINEPARISRSITILRKPNFRDFPVDCGYSPSSPDGSNALDSPFTPSPRGGDLKKMRRKSTPEGEERAEPRSPTVYDWVVISALDR